MTVGSQDEAGRNCFEAKTNQRSASPLRSGGEAAENVFTALLRGYNKRRRMDIPVLDVDSLPVRSGGAADYPPQLSVVIPVYNVDTWLGPCLRSLQAQTFTAWECWLIDDGATDLSGKVCDNYAKKDTRFHVIHQENKGVSAARNAGIEASKAPYLTFIDPDDFINEVYFEELLTAMKAIDADISVATWLFVDEEGREGVNAVNNEFTLYNVGKYKKYFLSNEEVQDALCDNRFSCVCWGKIFKRSLWGRELFPVGIDLGEDMMTVPPVVIQAKSAVCSLNARYYYRVRKKSLLHGTVSAERFRKDLYASGKMVEKLTAYSPARKGEFELLKLLYDVGCLANYQESSPAEFANKSKLYTLCKFLGDVEKTGVSIDNVIKTAGKLYEKSKKQDYEMD